MIPCLHLGIAAVFNHSYFVVSIMGSWHWKNQLLFILFTLAIGILPIGFICFVNRYASKNTIAQQVIHTQNNSNNSNQALNIVETAVTVAAPLITLTGDNKGDMLHVALAQLLFIKVADNYCEIAILTDNKVSHELLRSSLTRILKQLPSNSMIHRCHRSYAVNLALVELSTGNAGGLQLLMKPMGVTVPVSRTYVDAIKQGLLLAPKAC